MIPSNVHGIHDIACKFMKCMGFHPPEQPAALLGPQKPIGFLREAKVLGRAGARGGAGAERDANDSNLVELTKSLGIYVQKQGNCDDCVFSLNSNFQADSDVLEICS